jgi:hypothetical protein
MSFFGLEREVQLLRCKGGGVSWQARHPTLCGMSCPVCRVDTNYPSIAFLRCRVELVNIRPSGLFRKPPRYHGLNTSSRTGVQGHERQLCRGETGSQPRLDCQVFTCFSYHGTRRTEAHAGARRIQGSRLQPA